MTLRHQILAAAANTQSRAAAVARILAHLSDDSILAEMRRHRGGALPNHNDFVESEGLTMTEYEACASDPQIQARVADLARQGVFVTLHNGSILRGFLLQVVLDQRPL